MKQKITSALISACGMNCALCIGYQREKKKCPGCRKDSKDKPYHCQKCNIVFCKDSTSIDKKFCYECAKFPCRKIRLLDERYKTKYHMSMIDNLLFIKKNGIKNFIEKENKKWLCKNCGHLISVHRDRCLNCGNNIFFN